MEQPNPRCETKLSGANGDRENSFFLVQLTTSRIGNHIWLIPSLLNVTTTHKHTHVNDELRACFRFFILFIEVATLPIRLECSMEEQSSRILYYSLGGCCSRLPCLRCSPFWECCCCVRLTIGSSCLVSFYIFPLFPYLLRV